MAAKAALDHLEADATNTAGEVVIKLAGRKLTVLPIKQWRASGYRALREENIDLWAEKCLAPASYEAWQDIDPTLEQCAEFFTAWSEVTGESRPK